MSEYLQKKNLEGQKTTQDRMKELQDAERRAKEIRESLRTEKKKEFEEKVHNFHIFGMGFRPWSLNDMVILLVIAIIVVGGLSFVPGKDVSSDTSDDKGSFFTKLFGGFTVKSIEDTTVSDESNIGNSDEVSNGEVAKTAEPSDAVVDSGIIEGSSEVVDESKWVNFDMDVYYKYSEEDKRSFLIMNISNTDTIRYTLKLINKESFPITCNVNHYVNNNLKDKESTVVSIEAGNLREIQLREVSADTVNTLSKVKLEAMCFDGSDSSTQRTQTKLLKFYFS